MLQLTAWKQFFDPKARMRGVVLQREKKVRRLEPDEGEMLRAEVEGEQLVTVSLRSEGRKAVIECDSPQAADGVFCEHIWATLLHLVHEPAGPGATVDEVIKLKPQPPKARKREGARRPTRSNEPMWMGRLALLRPSAEDVAEETSSVFPVQRQVCYVVLPRASARHNGLVVELRQRTANATGWSKPKPLKVSVETIKSLTDPADREICALLLGATWVTEQESADAFLVPRTHAMYRVAPHAQRRLLKQMIATGRCVLDAGDPLGNAGGELSPLAWDVDETDKDAWSLHLHGVYDEEDPADDPIEADDELAQPTRPAVANLNAGGLRFEEPDEDLPVDNTGRDLLMDLQARRAGRRIDIHEPVLVLGGADGLLIHDGKVAAFDDREAWRWAAQFRDDRFTDDKADRPVMRVPAQDIERFLDRLYMLPHLPEIDLPEGLGRAEQAIEPRPHLDLHSPNSAPALELAPATAKNNLVGRLWFAYGDQRVSPVQPGRFVPVAASTQADSADTPQPDAQPTDASTDAPTGPEAADENPESQGGSTSEAPDESTGDTEVAVAQPPQPEPGQADPNADPLALPEDGARLIRRNRRAERVAIQQAATVGLRHIDSAIGDALLLPVRLMPTATARLINAGWTIAADQQALRTAGPPSLSITSGIDWFELRGNVTFTGEDGTEQEVSLPEVLAAARAGRHMVTLGDGTQGLLPQQWLEEHGLLTALGQLQGDHLRFRTSQVAMLDALLGERDTLTVDDTFARVREQLRAFDGVNPMQPADDFKGKLRSYQQRGLGWLGFLRRFGMGGILADDMGLGKTVQVLAMMQGRKLGLSEYTDTPLTEDGETPARAKTSIIVVPRSVIFNWVDEARKFTPELKVLAYTGPDRDQNVEALAQNDLVVTSYGLMRRDIDVLSQIDFDYAVLDEAQAIKNPQSQSAKAARLLKARHKLALTGTPIENHLGDLWSIFEYLNPGMLGSNARFAELIRGATGTTGRRGQGAPAGGMVPMPGALPPEGALPGGGAGGSLDGPEAEIAADAAAALADPKSEQDEADDARDALIQVAGAIRPFILRRTKQQVLTDLPAKTEQTIICEMDPAQRKIYDQLRTYYRGNLLKQLDTPGNGGKAGAAAAATSGGGRGLGKAAFMVLEALLRLRQAACHPALIDKTAAAASFDVLSAPSAKLDELEQRLDEIIDEGSKALVFSQFTSMLSLIRKRLDERGIKYAYLDGQTRNRKDVVDRFQTDPDLPVFLISLKAGGVGLNLTSAEYVFIMDPWWNPAVEAQAIDRTHRIGQTKPVFAYRMICEDTVEQRILELQGRKRDLAEAIVGGEENIIANLTRDDLERLLS